MDSILFIENLKAEVVMLGRSFIFAVFPYWNIKMSYRRRGFLRLCLVFEVSMMIHFFTTSKEHIHFFTRHHSSLIKHISGVLWPFPPRRSTRYISCVVLMFLHCWAELAAEHSSVRRCAVMGCRCQIFPPSPSRYQLIYVTVQMLIMR